MGGIIRVPREVAATFPVGPEGARFPELEEVEFDEPSAAASLTALGLRYSDFDVNQHVNNAAYLDLVQTALSRHTASPRPRQVALKYAKAIPPHTEQVSLRLEFDAAKARFSIEAGATICALGTAALS